MPGRRSRWLRATSSRAVLGAALTTAGVVAPAVRGVELLQEASEVLEDNPARLEFARAQVALGRALRQTGKRRDARLPLQRGLDLAVSLNAQPVIRLARSGSPPSARGPGGTQFTGRAP